MLSFINEVPWSELSVLIFVMIPLALSLLFLVEDWESKNVSIAIGVLPTKASVNTDIASEAATDDQKAYIASEDSSRLAA